MKIPMWFTVLTILTVVSLFVWIGSGILWFMYHKVDGNILTDMWLISLVTFVVSLGVLNWNSNSGGTGFDDCNGW